MLGGEKKDGSRERVKGLRGKLCTLQERVDSESVKGLRT